MKRIAMILLQLPPRWPMRKATRFFDAGASGEGRADRRAKGRPGAGGQIRAGVPRRQPTPSSVRPAAPQDRGDLRRGWTKAGLPVTLRSYVSGAVRSHPARLAGCAATR
jgi:hypothetical protein